MQSTDKRYVVVVLFGMMGLLVFIGLSFAPGHLVGQAKGSHVKSIVTWDNCDQKKQLMDE